ncbi:MAG: hypothetical protein WBM14_03695 [Terracidiphilus sp.]|jgi:hypothetical protein
MIDPIRRPLLRRFNVTVALLLFVAALGAQTPGPQTPAAPEWKTYTYPADGFSVSSPSAPEAQKRNVPTDAGSFELRSYVVEVGQTALFVGVCDYGSAVANRDPDTVLQGAKNGAVSNVSGHLVSEKKVTLGVYPGLEFEADNDTMHFSARIYLVGTTLYQTLIASPLANHYPDTTRFLDSFQLIARAQN